MWVRFPPGPPRSRLILLVVVSAALHLLVVVLLLLRPPPPIADSQPDAAGVAMVFASASPRQAASPHPGNGPGARSARTTQAHPAPRPTPPAPPQPRPVTPQPRPVTPQPRPVTPPAPSRPAPTPPAPTPPVPKTAPKPPPSPPAAKPAPGPPVATRPVPLGQEQVNLPPLPALVGPLPALTAPTPPPSERAPASSSTSRQARLPASLNLAPARPVTRGFSLAGGGSILDPFGLDAGGRNVRQGALHESVSSDLRGAEAAGPDWGAALLGWVEEHKHYPEQAIAHGDDGDATVDVTVDRYGKVRDVVLVGPSGSRYLDSGLEGLFRGQHLPPFPVDIGQETMTFTFVMHYILER